MTWDNQKSGRAPRPRGWLEEVEREPSRKGLRAQCIETHTRHLLAIAGAETGEAGEESYYCLLDLSKFGLESPWGYGGRLLSRRSTQSYMCYAQSLWSKGILKGDLTKCRETRQITMAVLTALKTGSGNEAKRPTKMESTGYWCRVKGYSQGIPGVGDCVIA